MASKMINNKKGERNERLVYEFVRPHQRRKLSRYKLKKQEGILENILNDPQVMGM